MSIPNWLKWLGIGWLAAGALGCSQVTWPSPTPPPQRSPTPLTALSPSPPVAPAVATTADLTTATPSLSLSPTTPATTATSTATPYRLAVADAAPAQVAEAARGLTLQYPSQFGWTEEVETADILLTVDQGKPVAQWIYAVAAPFATVSDGVALAQLQTAWQSDSSALGTLILDGDTAVSLATLWGEPKAPIVSADQLAPRLWQQRPSWTILPFHQLQPDLKVLQLDGQSPLAPDFDADAYPLTLFVGAVGAATAVDQLLAHWPGLLTNRDPARLTRIAMTGPSGLARAVADRMEEHGLTYPGRHVAPVLGAADFAHLSNEVPFAPDCPAAEQDAYGDTQFCARDAYLELMTYVGTDINEMTGNHVNDWGQRSLQHTFDLYEKAGIRTFGGGRDLSQARQPLLLQHHGNKIAFVGCNPIGPYYAWAREGYAGALRCDDDSFMRQQIRQLDETGNLVIATLQYLEYYRYAPSWQQERDFGALAQAGAAAVSGSQGHHAQGFAFHQGAFIHYGLGNLFFDQMHTLGTRQSFIDTYVIYDNRLLSVTLWTGLIEDYCCPRPMTTAERKQLLQTVFQASGWQQ